MEQRTSEWYLLRSEKIKSRLTKKVQEHQEYLMNQLGVEVVEDKGE